MVESRKRIYQTEDLASYLLWEEEETYSQSASTEDRQALWELSLEWIKEVIPKSEEYKRKIDALVIELRGLRLPGDSEPHSGGGRDRDSSAKRLLWSIILGGHHGKDWPR